MHHLVSRHQVDLDFTETMWRLVQFRALAVKGLSEKKVHFTVGKREDGLEWKGRTGLTIDAKLLTLPTSTSTHLVGNLLMALNVFSSS